MPTASVDPSPRRPLRQWLHWPLAAAVLALPALAMRFTDEVDWSLSDFLVMGALLSAVCLAWEAALRGPRRIAWRAASGLAILTGFLTVWATLAVGLVGGAVDIAFPVLVAAVASVALAVGRHAGRLAVLMATAGCVHALVLGLASAAGMPAPWQAGAFVIGWLAAAGLFSRCVSASKAG
ncbi:hypothetical protein [Pseudomarimonas salicorniae]|uniref:Uncharacterized protein n=1 Tax=Pseudomarimonas salicorniae TaxID=2933270 RepID=A0ABT0GFT1_9GAMM|nr:hypothetical protein [Lysobacter sp. CAU 1642]MCK7592902.1 hypothetical protein [Lysobacter sp. CAU 1642]